MILLGKKGLASRNQGASGWVGTSRRGSAFPPANTHASSVPDRPWLLCCNLNRLCQCALNDDQEVRPLAASTDAPSLTAEVRPFGRVSRPGGRQARQAGWRLVSGSGHRVAAVRTLAPAGQAAQPVDRGASTPAALRVHGTGWRDEGGGGVAVAHGSVARSRCWPGRPACPASTARRRSTGRDEGGGPPTHPPGNRCPGQDGSGRRGSCVQKWRSVQRAKERKVKVKPSRLPAAPLLMYASSGKWLPVSAR